jgi:hypothetical protein
MEDCEKQIYRQRLSTLEKTTLIELILDMRADLDARKILFESLQEKAYAAVESYDKPYKEYMVMERRIRDLREQLEKN